MRLEIKAILQKVEEVQEKGDLKFQYILLEKPIYDNFEGTLVRTVYYPATLFNDKITEINAKELEGKKVTCVCYLNSQESKTEDKIFHNLRLKVVSMKELEVETKESA